jgi:predicted phage terminase large subunit-like protein
MKTTNPTPSDELLWEEIRNSKQTRIKLARESQYWFFHIYFGENTKYKTADFQKEIYSVTSDQEIAHAVICAFRGSGKSTIATLCCPIWSILGSPEKKFVLILSQTQPLAKAHLQNIKRAFETNDLLRKDFGPLEETSDEWGSMSLVLTKYNARISAASVDQSIRGIRHGAYRPDLIIADDVEDMASVKTRESRERTYQWFVSEVIPAGDHNTKIINIGNLLHEDSLIMRLKEGIEKNEIDGVYHEYPIVDENDKPLWIGKYPDKAAIDRQQKKVVSEKSWLREYMLRIVADTGQVIKPEWVQFYDELPPKNKEYEFIGSFIGVDLAISLKDAADFSAVVMIHVYGYETEDRRYFIDARYINRKMTFLQTVEEIVNYYNALKIKEHDPIVLVEEVGYQGAMVETLDRRGAKTKGIKVKGDKHSRLTAAGMLFEQKRVLFDKTDEAKEHAQQIVGFGKEKHDDLVDATTLALNYIHSNVEYGITFSMCFLGDDDEDEIVSYGITYRDEK